MILVLDGAQYVDIAGQTIKANEGDILFYPMHVPHAEWTEPGTVLESAFLSCEWNGMPKGVPLKVIAEKAGMDDQYHMSHLFKRVTGTSPGRLRSKQEHPA